MGDAMSWMRRRLNCCPISNATEDEASIAIGNEVQWGGRANPTPLLDPVVHVPLRGFEDFGPLPVRVKAPPPNIRGVPPRS